MGHMLRVVHKPLTGSYWELHEYVEENPLTQALAWELLGVTWVRCSGLCTRPWLGVTGSYMIMLSITLLHKLLPWSDWELRGSYAQGCAQALDWELLGVT